MLKFLPFIAFFSIGDDIIKNDFLSACAMGEVIVELMTKDNGCWSGESPRCPIKTL